MHCKSTRSDMDDVSEESFSSGFGLRIGGLGCELGTTEDVTGSGVANTFEEV